MNTLLPASTRCSAMVPTWTSVSDVQRDTHDTFTLTLAPPQGWSGFEPGQFNMLYVFGVGEVPISVSGDPMKHDVLVHTIRAVGSVTHAMDRLEVGSLLGVRGPFGTDWPIDEFVGKDVILVSGGIGLAPLRPVLYALMNRREEFGSVTLLHGARSPRDLLYREQLAAWTDSGMLRAWITVDHPDDTWTENVGLVTSLFTRLTIDPTKAVGLMCGPEIMMRYVLREFEQRELPPESMHVSLERNMQCAVGLCGHCQMGPYFLCTDGPVFRYDQIAPLFDVREV